MNQKQIRKLISLILCAGILLFPIMGNAAMKKESSTADPNAISTATLTFSEETSTSGYFYVSAAASKMPTYLTAKVTLQSAPSGSKSFANVTGVSAKSKTVYDTRHISFSGYFPISSSKDYRIKVEFTDDCTGNAITSLYYKTLDR